MDTVTLDYRHIRDVWDMVEEDPRYPMNSFRDGLAFAKWYGLKLSVGDCLIVLADESFDLDFFGASVFNRQDSY